MGSEQQGTGQQWSGQQGAGGGSMLLAFILGAAAGAAVALLFAPASGEDTRRAMNERTREGRERVLEALRQGRGILNQRREHLVSTFERARQQAQNPAGSTGQEG
jgi:gas vesicle protein